jgi:hypothetical protein
MRERISVDDFPTSEIADLERRLAELDRERLGHVDGFDQDEGECERHE